MLHLLPETSVFGKVFSFFVYLVQFPSHIFVCEEHFKNYQYKQFFKGIKRPIQEVFKNNG